MTAINWTNMTDLSQLPAAANTATDGSFWSGVLYLVWVVIFLLTLYFGFEIALITSGFIGLIIAVFLVYAGLVNFTNILFFLALILVSFFYIIWSSSKVKIS